MLQSSSRCMRLIGRKEPQLMKLDRKVLQSLPKVLLHDHLDGGLRPQPVIELARDGGYKDLPTVDPQALAQWFFRGANQGSLGKYLEGLRTPSRSCRRKRLCS